MRDTFRKFRLSFYVYIAYILAALFYGITAALLNPKPIIASNTSQIIIVIFAIIFLVAWFLFLFNLSKLATAARKNAALWVIGAVFFHIMGMTVAYFRMKSIAIRNGWV